MQHADYEIYEGLRLPLRRSNKALNDNAAYLASIREQIGHVRPFLSPDCRILDFGCGQGRLLNGLLHQRLPFGAYIGVDVDPRAVAWCCTHLSHSGAHCSFYWYNYANARYNKSGIDTFSLPLQAGGIDLVFSNSVFTHLDKPDIAVTARGLLPLLRPGGRLYVTAFVERDVPEITINPEGYLGSKGAEDTALHWVRYNYDFFVATLEKEGFRHHAPQRLEAQRIPRSGQHWLFFEKPAEAC